MARQDSSEWVPCVALYSEAKPCEMLLDPFDKDPVTKLVIRVVRHRDDPQLSLSPFPCLVGTSETLDKLELPCLPHHNRRMVTPDPPE